MKDLAIAIRFFIIFTVVCGGIYPVVVTGVSQALFLDRASGSFIADKNGRVVGSSLIGQPFADPKYFWSRPSATPPFGHNPQASAGSNLGPANPAFLQQVAERVNHLRQAGISGPVPSDLAFASASGLDPHISPASALAQAPRIAQARGLEVDAVLRLVADHAEDRQLGIFGEPRVNVLVLNLALDKL